jgi:cysteine-rich repeat protein
MTHHRTLGLLGAPHARSVRGIGFLLGVLCAASGVACSSEPGKSVDTADTRAQLSPAQGVSVFCGDGIRDPLTEECDDGLGSAADLCSARCQVTDTLAGAGAPLNVARRLGEGRHPAAGAPGGFGVVFVEPDPKVQIPNVTPPLVGLAAFDAGGDPRARIAVSAGGNPLLSANPVVAALPGSPASYAVAWTDFNGDGDELGIALRRVSVSTPDGSKLPTVGAAAGATLSALQFANSGTAFSQYDPDVLAVGASLVVAWTDSADAGTAPDVRFRTFSADSTGFTAQADDQTLSATSAFESNVALAPFGTSWAAAWRASTSDAQETIEIRDNGGGTRWSVGPHLPADGADHPALADLGNGKLLVLYTVGTDPGATGTANVGKLRAAVLDVAQASVTAVSVTPSTAALADANVSESEPSLVSAGSSWYFAWRSAAQPGDANGDELWLRRVSAVGAASLTLDPEQRLPRWPSGTPGDQRFPALFAVPALTATQALPGPAPSGGLLLAWDDYGKTAGTGEGQPDVLVQFAPLPLLRFPDQRRTDCTVALPCNAGEGDCDSNAECKPGLVCATGAGPKFGLGPDVDVCVPSHCSNGTLDAGELGVDCGGPDCGHCNCGDGVTSGLLGEQCDDGNAVNTDDCLSTCRLPTCGDGFVHAGVEACDTAGQTASCEANCTKPVCGDGTLNILAGEACEDGNQVNTDDCVACKKASCGDGFVWLGHEACDSHGVATSSCDVDCTLPVCGDGLTNTAAGETCDDSNTVNTDACVACHTATCGDGFLWAGHETCDDGNAVNTDACVACLPARCGDGFIWAGHEACDSGGVATASCDVDCTAPLCGDGIVNTAAGEICEPSLNPNCRADCKAFLGCTNGATCLGVQHIANGPTGDNQLQPFFQIVNNGAQSVALNQLKLRYYFTRVDDADPASATCQSKPALLDTFCDWAQIGCANVTRSITYVTPWLKGVDTYFDLTFAGSTVLAPGQSSGPIQLRVSRSDFANSIETDDYSFKTGTTYAFNPKIALFKSGTLVWGTIPTAPLACGDGVVDHCEACDTTHESAACNANCSLARCGDGILNVTRGEVCDTAGASAACDADCTAVVCGDGVVNPAAGEVCEPSLAQGCLSTCKGFNGLVGCTNGGTCLKVQNLATDSATDSQVLPHLKIINNGGAPIPLSELSVRYWFTNDGTQGLQAFCDWASLSSTTFNNDCAQIKQSFTTLSPVRTNADRYLEVHFTSSNVLAPGGSTGEIQLRFAKLDWSNFNENNDYSHRISSTYLDTTKITVYRNGVLIWGTPP